MGKGSAKSVVRATRDSDVSVLEPIIEENKGAQSMHGTARDRESWFALVWFWLREYHWWRRHWISGSGSAIKENKPGSLD